MKSIVIWEWREITIAIVITHVPTNVFTTYMFFVYFVYLSVCVCVFCVLILLLLWLQVCYCLVQGNTITIQNTIQNVRDQRAGVEMKWSLSLSLSLHPFLFLFDYNIAYTSQKACLAIGRKCKWMANIMLKYKAQIYNLQTWLNLIPIIIILIHMTRSSV